MPLLMLGLTRVRNIKVTRIDDHGHHMNKCLHVSKHGRKLKQGFLDMQQKYPIIGDVRGLGAMAAIELVKDRKTKEPASGETNIVLRECYKNGLILLTAEADHNVIRVPVPLVVSDEELEEGLSILDEVLKRTPIR